MSTKMSEKDWEVVLSVFRSCLPRRGDKARNDRLFLEALHYFSVHNIHLARSSGTIWSLEFGVEAVFAPQPIRRVRGLFRRACCKLEDRASGADGRQHGDPRACFGGRRQRGQADQALGRSRGGFGTKIHLKTDHQGQPIGFELTGGERNNAASCPERFLAFSSLQGLPQRKARHLRQETLSRQGTHRAGHRQAQTLQAHRPSM